MAARALPVRSGMAALVVGGLSFLAGEGFGYQQGKQAIKPTVGLVDFAKVFEQIPQAHEQTAELKSQFEERRERLQELDSNISASEARLETLNPGSVDRRIAEMQLDARRQELRALERILQDEMDQKNMQMVVWLYEQAGDAVANVARKRGIDLVLRRHRELPEDLPLRAKYREVEETTVWYSSAKLDITKPVIAYMKAQHAKAAEGNASPAAASGDDGKD